MSTKISVFIVRKETDAGCEIIVDPSKPEKVTWEELEKRTNDPNINGQLRGAYRTILDIRRREKEVAEKRRQK